MKRWRIAFGVAVLACVPLFLDRSTSSNMLLDTDTAVLLQTLRARHAPLSWFSGDWPLQNHFYRPVSTLTFELDNAIWGSNAGGYGLTNALLCIASVLLLFWFVREVSGKPFYASAAAVIFAIWNVSYGSDLAAWATWLAIVPLIGLLLPGRRVLLPLLCSAAWLFVCSELIGMWPLEWRMIGWLPGRTASCMTVFALAAMAAYARYERLSAERMPGPPPSPFDIPDYKRKQETAHVLRWPWMWALLSAFCVAMALGSYEQAVMLPAALLGVALTMRWQRYRVRFAWTGLFFAILGGYLALRWSVLPHGASHYQAQQLRSGGGVLISIMEYVFPLFVTVRTAFDLFDQGAIVLILPQWTAVYVGIAEYCSILRVLRKDWVLPLAGWALSSIAFLPMAWVKHFEHYHYWPMAMRSLFVAALIPAVAKSCVNALSPREVQAPPRPDPAPGSLPHP